EQLTQARLHQLVVRVRLVGSLLAHWVAPLIRGVARSAGGFSVLKRNPPLPPRTRGSLPPLTGGRQSGLAFIPSPTNVGKSRSRRHQYPARDIRATRLSA